MKRSLSFVTVCVSLVLSSFPICVFFAHALSVSPPIIEHRFEPGREFHGTVLIQNSSETASAFRISFQNFSPFGEEGQQSFVAPNDVFPSSRWFSAESETLVLQPREIRDVAYRVAVPADASPGGHYVAMFFSSVPASQENSASPDVGVSSKVGVLFLLRVSGVIREDARVEQFTISPSNDIRELPVSFDLRVRNLGNVHLEPTGEIIIRNAFGRVTARVPLNADRAAVLPQSLRRYTSAWTEGEESVFAIGRYTAEIQGEYGDSRQPLRGSVSFWIIPWRPILIFGAVFLLLLIAGSAYTRFLVRRLVKKAKRKT